MISFTIIHNNFVYTTIINYRALLKYESKSGKSLISTAYRGSVDVVDHLLNNNADPNQGADGGYIRYEYDGSSFPGYT